MATPLVIAKTGDLPLLTKRLFDLTVTSANIISKAASIIPNLDV
jgi:hypothetical protein